DSVNGSFSITVDDDSPIIVPASIQNGAVDEERLSGGNAGDSYGDGGDLADGGTLTATGTLGVSYGVDGPAGSLIAPGTPSLFNFNSGGLNVDPFLAVNAHFGIVSGAIAGGQN